MYYTPSPIGFGNPTSVLTVQDEGSRHNLSRILSQLPDLTSVAIQSGRVFDLPGPFQGHQIFQKQLLSCKLFNSLPKQKKNSTNTYHKKKKRKKAQHLHHPKHKITHGNTLNKNKATYKKVLINELQLWPIICPFVT